MLEIKTGLNPYAVEIHRDGESIGTIRWDNGDWRVMMAAPEGFVTIPWEVLELVIAFRANRS